MHGTTLGQSIGEAFRNAREHNEAWCVPHRGNSDVTAAVGQWQSV